MHVCAGHRIPQGGTTNLHIARLGTLVCVAAVVAATFTSVPASAVSRSEAIRIKREQVAAAEKQISAARTDLTTAMAAYDEASTQLDGARNDLDSTNATIEMLEQEIVARQGLLDERVASMYKAGGYEMLQALLSVETFDDLLTRMDLFSFIQDSDTELIVGLTTSRRETDFLRQQQLQRETELIALRQQADARLATVNSAMARQKAIVDSLGAEIAALVKEQEAAEAAAAAAAALNDGTPNPPVPFDPNTIVSDATYLDSDALSVDGIQAFLEAQPGKLDTYTGRDHNGVTKRASDMIAEAALAYGVNPKVILVTLQKEQSLISRSELTQYALDWAMGCGKMDSRTLPEYAGFGNQIWSGARVLVKNRTGWRAGMSLSIDGKAVSPSNASTLSLYRYTPHFHGNTSFWKLYWKYFGDPLR